MSLLIGFWHFVRFVVLAVLGLMVASGLVEAFRQAVRKQTPPQPASPPPEPPSPKRPPEARDLKSIKPGAALKAIRESLSRKEVVERIDDVRLGLAEAHSALVADLDNAVDVAAARLARCRWATGVAWRRHLHEIGEPDAGALVARALADDIEPIAGELARRLAGVPSPTMIDPDGAPALACDACGKAAMTFGISTKGVRCSTLSPVNTVALVDALAAADLVDAIHARNASAAIHFLNASGPGCQPYCAECDRVYCKEHYAIESQWSGSWHEATNATCPLGHWREIE